MGKIAYIKKGYDFNDEVFDATEIAQIIFNKYGINIDELTFLDNEIAIVIEEFENYVLLLYAGCFYFNLKIDVKIIEIESSDFIFNLPKIDSAISFIDNIYIIEKYFYKKDIKLRNFENFNIEYFDIQSLNKLNITFITEEKIEQIKKEKLKQNLEVLEKYKNILIRHFGEDKVDLQMDLMYSYLIILFPEITIVNAKNQKHKLLDLYLVFKFDNGNNKICQFYCCRGIQTWEEFEYGYLHSHLETTEENNKFKINEKNFCTGNGEFARMISDIEMTNNYELFEQICYILPSYLAWENDDYNNSPYFRFTHLIKKINLSVYSPIQEIDYQEIFLPKLLEKINENQLEFINNNITINEECLFEILDSITKELKISSYDVIKIDGAQYLKISKNTAPETITNNLVGEFKGQPVYTKCVSDSNLIDIVPKIRKEFVMDIKQKIETKLNELIYEYYN